MAQIERLEGRWGEILKELSQLKEMRRGSIVEQYVETVRADGSKGKRGPYTLYSYKEKAKTISRRLSDPGMVRIYQGQIKAFRRFQELIQELITLGERISDSVISGYDFKKKPKSLLSKTKK